jgi:Chaperone of endosialidase
MTFLQYRSWGYVSSLSGLRCGGPSQSTLNTQNSIAQQQLDVAKQSQVQSQQDTEQRKALEAPLIAKETALATGDRTAAVSAAMPEISAIGSGINAAKQNIMNTLPPGAARDTALAQLQTQAAVAPQQAIAGQIQQAPEILANVGQGVGAFSIQELGASLSGFGGAATTNQSVLQAQTQQQAAKLGVAGELVGAAGTAAGGIFGGKGSDRRLKKNIRQMEPVLNRVESLNLVRFQYLDVLGEQAGVVAQELETIFPEMVYHSQDGMLYVRYDMFVGVGLKALQELAAKVHEQSIEIQELKRDKAYSHLVG